MHFLRNVLTLVPKGTAEMVAAAIRTIFAQPDADHVRAQLDDDRRDARPPVPGREAMLLDANRTTCSRSPTSRRHWKKIWSTNPLERVNKEIKRRTDVVGVFPNPEALLRLAGAVLVEIHDEWAVADRRYLSEESMKLLSSATKEVATHRRTHGIVETSKEPRHGHLHHAWGLTLGACASHPRNRVGTPGGHAWTSVCASRSTQSHEPVRPQETTRVPTCPDIGPRGG